MQQMQGQCEPRAEMQAALAIYAEAKPALGEAKGRALPYSVRNYQVPEAPAQSAANLALCLRTLPDPYHQIIEGV